MRYVPALGDDPGQAAHPVPRERHAAHRGGDGLRGLHRQRVDPLPPAVAVPRQGGRRVRADRARGVGARHARAPAHRRRATSRRTATRSPAGAAASATPTSRSRSAARGRGRTTSTATARATRSIFVHEGSGTLETIFGALPYREGDYVVIPRGTTYRFRSDGPAALADVRDARARSRRPNRYRNHYGQLLEHAPYSHRDIHPPAELRDRTASAASSTVKVRVRGGYQDYVLDYHPFDVVGWDGYVYPYTFNIDDFEPITGRIHQPPPAHQTFQGPNFVICSFCPRKLDFDPHAIAAALPPLERAVGGDDLLRLRQLRPRAGRRRRLDHAAPVGPAARPAAGHGGEVARRQARPRSWR